MTDNTFWFLGGDAAPSESARSDDGALVAMRATPRHQAPDGALSNNPADWWRDVLYARRIRKASARQWSGIIHQLHRRFNFARICLDPGGGGQWVKRELCLSRQTIENIDTEVTPIVTPDETSVVQAHFILSMCKRGDPCIESQWPSLTGDDVLVDTLYSSLKEALDHCELGFVPPIKDWPRERMMGWSEEKVWCLKNLTVLLSQLKNILVATKEDGSWLFTKRNARQFGAKGKKDFVSGLMYANTAFLTWLKENDGQWDTGSKDPMFSSF